MNIFYHDKILDLVDPYQRIFRFNQNIIQEKIRQYNVREKIESNLYFLASNMDIDVFKTQQQFIIENQQIISDNDQQYLQFNLQNCPFIKGDSILFPDIIQYPQIFYKIETQFESFQIQQSGEYKFALKEKVELSKINFVPLLRYPLQCIQSSDNTISQFLLFQQSISTNSPQLLKQQSPKAGFYHPIKPELQYNPEFNLLKFLPELEQTQFTKAQIKQISDYYIYLNNYGVQVYDIIDQNIEIYQNTYFQMNTSKLDLCCVDFISINMDWVDVYCLDSNIQMIRLYTNQYTTTFQEFKDFYHQLILGALELDCNVADYLYRDFDTLQVIEQPQQKMILIKQNTSDVQIYNHSLKKPTIEQIISNVNIPSVKLDYLQASQNKFDLIVQDSIDQNQMQHQLPNSYDQFEIINQEFDNSNEKIYLVKWNNNAKINWVTQKFVNFYPLQLKQFQSKPE